MTTTTEETKRETETKQGSGVFDTPDQATFNALLYGTTFWLIFFTGLVVFRDLGTLVHPALTVGYVATIINDGGFILAGGGGCGIISMIIYRLWRIP